MSIPFTNQHYIPQMYLKRFSTNEKRINVLMLDKDIILKEQATKNFATRRFYYDTTPEELRKGLAELIAIFPDIEDKIDFSDEKFIEKLLGLCEAETKKVLNEIERDTTALYKAKNQEIIMSFLHYLTYRTESYRERIESKHVYILDYLKNLNINPELVEGLGNDGRTTQISQLMEVSSLLRTCSMLYNNYDWFLGKATGDMCFVISDDPCKGILQGLNDICFPISGMLAIIFRIKDGNAPLISYDKPVGNIISLSYESVLKYNTIQLAYAKKFLFGDYQSLVILQGFKKFITNFGSSDLKG